MSIIREHFPRIRVLDIHHTNPSQPMYMAPLFPYGRCNHLPQLEYLFVNLLEPCEDEYSFQRNTGPISASELKVCNLPLIAAGVWESLSPNTVSSLTGLSVAFYYNNYEHISGATKLLDLCQNLKIFSWSIFPLREWHHPVDSPSVSSSLQFPRLHTLSLKLCTSSLFVSTARHLDAPQLRSLTVHGPKLGSVSWIEPLFTTECSNPGITHRRVQL
ncbi:hypothetical protein M422DRAFT_277131 [Sphaerobolus stellatus SS14]|uniref:Uncharacterized protein n=1 Tax=Sphaerobolus stellatus (strain SS14) TaxID=990650 RepID=A0A0C9TKS9_SPHS4|nr:hypothetical protein M422DRAFT_277131 [Sphaerobolus stellatus SS14]